MKLKLTCGNCGHAHIFEESIIYINNMGCPECGVRYTYHGNVTVGMHDESAITLDDVRAVIREELAAARIVPRG